MISQELWAYFGRNHSLTLLDSELDDILHTVNSERELKIQQQAAAIDAAERKNAALAEALSDAVTSMLDSGYAPTHLIIRKARAALSLPASSGPEQTKCKTCKDTGEVASYPDEIYCPENCEAARKLMADCAKDRAEPKCVCESHRSTKICDKYNPMSGFWGCYRCGHDKGCHTPAPAAKEVMPRSE